MPELIVTSEFLRQINDSELDDGEVDDMNLTMVRLMIVPLIMTMRITKVQQAANQQYSPLAILPRANDDLKKGFAW